MLAGPQRKGEALGEIESTDLRSILHRSILHRSIVLLLVLLLVLLVVLLVIMPLMMLAVRVVRQGGILIAQPMLLDIAILGITVSHLPQPLRVHEPCLRILPALITLQQLQRGP
jgi:hypothetical protein